MLSFNQHMLSPIFLRCLGLANKKGGGGGGSRDIDNFIRDAFVNKLQT